MIESNQPIQLSDRMDTIYHHCRLPANTILQYFHFTQPTTELLLSDPDWGRSLKIQQLFTESLTHHLHQDKTYLHDQNYVDSSILRRLF